MRFRLSKISTALLAVIISAPVMAEEQTSEEQVERISVTGSRIKHE